jgi:nucleoside-diphosphate-sugar epimerase
MRILVIGGTRFIGAAVVQHLHAAGHTVAVFHRGQTERGVPEGIEHITGDARKLSESRAALLAFAPEIVLHNIVLSDRDVAETQAIFTGVARRLIMTSSMDVYRMFGRVNGHESGERLPLPADEDAPLRTVFYPYRAQYPDPEHPMHHYDKIPAEQLALSSAELPATVLRLPMVIGEGDYQKRLLPFVVPMVDGRKVLLMSDMYAAWQSTYGYVGSVAAAMALAATDDRALGRVYNVADGAYTSLELAQTVADALSWQGEIVTAPEDALPESLRFGVADPHPVVCSAARIERELGFKPPIPFVEGLRSTALWDASHLPDPLPDGLRDYVEQDAALAALRGG